MLVLRVGSSAVVSVVELRWLVLVVVVAVSVSEAQAAKQQSNAIAPNLMIEFMARS